MKLYFAAGACSLAPHIVLRDAGYTFDRRCCANPIDYMS
jgi:hypothetical protein